MNKYWDFKSRDEMLSHLIGENYGTNPAQALSEIQKDKRTIAETIKVRLKLGPEDVGLDIGSGPGFIALALSKSVKQLHCFDISSSFLNLAKEHCKDAVNISFHLSSPAGNTSNLDFLAASNLSFCYSENVFCHLNQYEIDLYMDQVSNKLKPGGLFLFDFLDFTMLDFKDPIYQNMKGLFSKGTPLNNLYNYNSQETIGRLAEYHGFKIQDVLQFPVFGSCSICLKKL